MGPSLRWFCSCFSFLLGLAVKFTQPGGLRPLFWRLLGHKDRLKVTEYHVYPISGETPFNDTFRYDFIVGYMFIINKCFDSVWAYVTFRAVTANGDDFFVATQLTSRHSYKVRFKTTSCSDRKDDYGVLEYNPNLISSFGRLIHLWWRTKTSINLKIRWTSSRYWTARGHSPTEKITPSNSKLS